MKTLDEVKAEAIRRGIGPGYQIVTPFQNKKSIPKSAKWAESSGAFWLVYGGQIGLNMPAYTRQRLIGGLKS